jgi:large subunit ribosomal protein L9
MKVLLLKDVYKLGRAGDIKKVADGYGRNYLLPHNFAVLATAGAINQAEYIRSKATESRAKLNNEMGSIAEIINNVTVSFTSKAGETGKLYGSITSQMIADALSQKYNVKIDRRQVEAQPIRLLGEHKAHVRLTIDLVPEIKVIVYREGEKLANQQQSVAPKSEQSAVGNVVANPETQAE